MKNVILVRFGEIFLKGKNRFLFERVLIANIKHALSGFSFSLVKTQGRYIIENYDMVNEKAILNRLVKVAGLHSVSVASVVPTDFKKICELAISFMKDKKGTFRIEANRADKTFTMTSMDLARELGGVVLDSNSSLKVDLHKPDIVLNVDLRENGQSFVFFENIPCIGGMPVSSCGRGLLLLSGGIDSPVAGYRIARRGMKLSYLHFESFPYTSAQAEEKARRLAKVVSQYNGQSTMYIVSVANIQKAIHESCDPNYMITLVRRFMMRIASKICEDNKLQAIVTGESLGQVASQTIESMTVVENASRFPLLKPLVDMDKFETIEIAKKIGSFDISIEPYDDCCTVFLPDSPVIKPKLGRVLFEESKLDVDALVESALKTIRVETIE